MEPIIENVTVETEEIIREGMMHLYGKMFRRNNLLRGIFTAVLVAVAIYRQVWYFWLFAGVYTVLFVWYLFTPWRDSRKNYKRLLAYFNQNVPPATSRFYDEHFEISSTDAWETIPYDKVEGAAMLKRCVVVKVKERPGGFVFCHDGYRKGSPQELLDLLRAKCPYINPANRNGQHPSPIG